MSILKTLAIMVLCGLFALPAMAQQQDTVAQKKRKELAIEAIKELKNGALVIRLKTKTQAIKSLQMVIKDTTIKEKKRKRHQAILDGIVKKRDDINKAMLEPARDSFTFCKVYFMFDSESRLLLNGTKSGIFLNDSMQLDTSIRIAEESIFILDFVEQNAEYPYDVLILQRLKGAELKDPFPHDMPVRASLVTDATDALVRRAMFRFYQRWVLFYKDKN